MRVDRPTTGWILLWIWSTCILHGFSVVAFTGNCVNGSAGDSQISVEINRWFQPGEFFCVDGGSRKFGITKETPHQFGYWMDDRLVWSPPAEQQTNLNRGGPGQWIFQSDGNLVLYDTSGGATIWASNRDSVDGIFLENSKFYIASNSIQILHDSRSDPIWRIDLSLESDWPSVQDCIGRADDDAKTLRIPTGTFIARGKGYCLGDFYLGLTRTGQFGYFELPSTKPKSEREHWTPETSQGLGDSWIFQDDGNLVVYQGRDGGRAVWASSWETSSDTLVPDSQLWMWTSGALIRASGSGQVLWRTGPLATSGSCLVLSNSESTIVDVNRRFHQNEYICIDGGRLQLGLDPFGVFGIYDEIQVRQWKPSESKGSGSFWVFQSDGNLVVYSGDSAKQVAVWASNWNGRYPLDDTNQAYRLEFSVEGLRLWAGTDRVVWAVPLRSGVPQPVPKTSNDALTYLAYYYPWYIEGDWSRHGIQDIPRLGFYGTDSVSVAEQHVEWALQAGISSWVVSWWGRDGLAKRHFEEGMLRARNMNQMTFCILYESKILKGSNFRDGSAQNRLREDLLSIQNDYFGHPSYLHWNGRPVVIFYITRAVFKDGFDKSVLDMLRSALGQNVYFIADEPFFGNGNEDPDTSANAFVPPKNELTVFDAYTTYNMYQHKRVIPGETASDYMLREAMPIFEEWAKDTVFFPNVLPMYHDFRGKEPLIGNAQDFLRQLWEVLCLPSPPPNLVAPYDSPPRWVFVTSFNEWWEGTQIEPDSQNRYGTDFMDVLAASKKEVDEKGVYWC